MKKITISRFGGPEVLDVVEVPTPTPGPLDVRVRAHAIGVGWPDVYVRTGTYPWMHLFPIPATPGVEMSGIVEQIGTDVTRFKVGQPVYVSSALLGMAGSCYVESLLVPQDRLLALPSELSLDAAGNLAYYALALGMLKECGRGQRIRWVLVSGASGGVGTALVQVAKALGYQVIATVGHERKRRHSLDAGADHVLDYRDENLTQQILSITGGLGVDLWLESHVGLRFANALDGMAPWGKIVLYNAVGGHPPASFFDAWRVHMAKCLSIQYFSAHVWERDPVPIREMTAQAIDLLASGKVKPPPGTVFALSQVADAHRLLESGQHVGRIFLRADD